MADRVDDGGAERALLALGKLRAPHLRLSGLFRLQREVVGSVGYYKCTDGAR